MLDPSMAIRRALENAHEPHEICRRLTEHYLAGDEADKTALALALIGELAARVLAARHQSHRPPPPI